MPTSIKGIYQDGIIKPLVKLPQIKKAEVIITFIPQKRPLPTANAEKVLSVLNKFSGILGKDFPSGKTYISNIRKEIDKDWDKRIKRLKLDEIPA